MSTDLCCLSAVTFYIVCVGTVLSDKLPPPDNVRVISLDMGLVLEWDPPQSITHKHLSYTAELKGWNRYEAVCANSSTLSCDFTDNVTVFGTYQLRVRTELHGQMSDWVETNELSLDKITEVSSPHVQLKSRKGQTEVDITDPLMRRKNLRDVFGNIAYLIRFWKKGDVKKEELSREQNRVILSGLEPLVNYCVQVEILYLKNKTSQPSNETCVTNTPSNEVEPWLITVVLLVSFVVVLCVVVLVFLAVWFSYKGCRIMYPDAKLPEHLKQYLSERPQSSIFLAMQNSTQLKEHFHEVSIYHEEPTSSQDTQQTDRPIRIQANMDETQSGVERPESTVTSSDDEEEQLLDVKRL
ncbi:cytokine receptor family member b4 [Myxocyprinus asiaticus]|uniref:cytokine receptor family member b4 n=1 Tax=Myxocyprinus asiaticus TaxID=70543 RepID=UPI0022223C2B|nr:cytokine receptor family member b4 [Myxocyprinus asiaticus]